MTELVQREPTWQRAATRGELLAAKGALRVRVGGRWVALIAWRGKLYAVDDLCPHRGASLAEGIVEDGRVSCLEHGWEYSLETGKGVREWEGCVETFAVEERGDEIWVKVGPRPMPAWAAEEEDPSA